MKPSDLTIRLESLDELFTAPSGGSMTRDRPRLLSGIDELLNELGARRLRAVGSVRIVLPASAIEPDSRHRLKDQIGKFCELRFREADNDLRSMRHEGFQALLVGTIVLAGGLAMAALIASSSAPGAIRTFFGEGVFLVVAWVGAWYPLDLLIHYTGPLRRTKKLLQALSRMDVVVVPADAP